MPEVTPILPTPSAVDLSLPRYAELPDVGLYLEQVIRYVNRYTPSPLTASMVSNYVKQHTIPGPSKKAYGRDSIAYLICVSYLKTVASMEDIRLLMGIQRDSYSLSVAYDYFCDELENLLQFVYGRKQVPDAIGTHRTQQKMLLRSALLSIAYKLLLDDSLNSVRTQEQSAPEPLEV